MLCYIAHDYVMLYNTRYVICYETHVMLCYITHDILCYIPDDILCYITHVMLYDTCYVIQQMFMLHNTHEVILQNTICYVI